MVGWKVPASSDCLDIASVGCTNTSRLSTMALASKSDEITFGLRVGRRHSARKPCVIQPIPLRKRVLGISAVIGNPGQPGTAPNGRDNRLYTADASACFYCTGELGPEQRVVFEGFANGELTPCVHQRHARCTPGATGAAVYTARRYHNCVF